MFICPYCGKAKSKVTGTKFYRKHHAIWRRRECISCQERFTTYEVMIDENLNKTIDAIKKREESVTTPATVRNKIKRLVSKGISYEEIEKQLDIDRSLITSTIQRMRRAGEKKDTHIKKRLRKDKTLELHAKGLTAGEIAKIVDASVDTVRRYIRESRAKK